MIRYLTVDENFRTNGVRRVILTTNPQLHPFSNAQNAAQNYYCKAVDMKGFQYEIDLQAMPAGVQINQLEAGQVWWVEKRTSLYRLFLYGGQASTTNPANTPNIVRIDSTVPLPTAINGVVVSGIPTSGQSIVATSASGAYWATISGSGGSNNATQLQGYSIATVAPTNGQVLEWNGSDWTPTTPSSGGGSGITQLTGDVTAGPGSGSQAATLQATTNVESIISNNTTVTTTVSNLATLSGQYVSTSGNLTTLSGQFVTLSGQYLTTSGIVTTATGNIATLNNTVVTGTTGQITGGGKLSGGNITFGLATAGTAGTYGTSSGIPVITTDAYGRVTGVSVVNVSASGVTGTLPIANGGTGATTAINGFNALATSGGTVGGNLIVASGLTVSGTVGISGMTITGGTTTSGYVLTATSPSGSTWTAPVGAALPTSVNVWNGSSYTTLSNANSAFITGNYGAQSTARELVYMTLSAGTWLITGQVTITQTSNTTDYVTAYISGASTLTSASSYLGTGSGQDETITLNCSTVLTVASSQAIILYAITNTANGTVWSSITGGYGNATGLTAVRIA